MFNNYICNIYSLGRSLTYISIERYSCTLNYQVKKMLTAEQVTSKIAELMQTLDEVKKYNAITLFLPKFGLIIGGSLATFFALLTLFEVLEFEHILDTTMFLLVAFASLLIPIFGLLSGMFLIRKQIHQVKEREWETATSSGFAASLKLLIDLNWEKTLEEISNGRLGYSIYGLVKAGTYFVVTVSAFELLWNGFTLVFLNQIIIAGAIFWGFIAILLVTILIGNDLLKRYRELRALDMLVWELRWFSLEFGRAELKT
jgi:hypothetical protein